MDLNQIHLIVSFATLFLLIGLIFKAGGWYKSVNMRLRSLRKSHVWIRKRQETMVEDLNHKHEFNVSEINSVKTSQQLLAKDMEALEDRVSLVVDAQDDILKEMKKVKHCDGN